MAPKSPATAPSKMKAKVGELDAKGKKTQMDASKPTSETTKQYQLRNPSSAAGFKGQRSESNLRRGASTRSPQYSKASRSPLNTPGVSGLPRSKSTWTLGGSDKKDNVPRFMSLEHARSIRSVRYNAPPKIGEFKLPTIIGCTPTKSKFPELEPKHETRSERMIRAIKDPKGKMVEKYKCVMKQLSSMAMLKKMHKCLNTIKSGSSKHVEVR
ncbi:hypothetical protein N8T08_002277 [Aspergillus melleus]|uniref:Uncharacterized protein n=1 Tax=Aspergillus melleus TaxID=138277 RepID=A0ACC3B8L5_9EURO|nr:hypothetical protein N8T08_002277 [Aspergillus melleus]